MEEVIGSIPLGSTNSLSDDDPAHCRRRSMHPRRAVSCIWPLYGERLTIGEEIAGAAK